MQNMGLEHTRVFPLVVLKDITDNFSEERVIGRGASGVVYKGVLDNGEEIAVKKLHNHYDSSGNKLGNGETQFLNELMNLIGVQHQNIIRLVGYCYEMHSRVIECDGKRVLASEEERVLCLEYMQGGSLKDHLSDESCGLEWDTRFNIIKGVCEGLKYLHTGCENPIYHLDLKPENIWLDRNMTPKIGDFGISRLPAGSMQTYATENPVSGTIGYMAPEYIGWNQISQKCDVYSLGFIMIRVIAGENGPQNHDPHRPSEEFIESVHKNWGKRRKTTMSSHSLLQVKTCTEIALRCVELDREKRPTITDIVAELNKIDAAESSAVGGGQNMEEDHTTLEKQPDIQEQNKNNAEHLEGKMKDQVYDSMKNNLHTSVTMDLRKAFGVNSAILSPCSRWTGSMKQDLNGDLLHLQSGLQRLRETLPIMYNLIDIAEWKSHEKFVAMLFPKLKDAVYDADDLLDEFKWHDMKAKLEGNASKSPFIGFIDTVNQGSFSKLNDVQGRLDYLSSQLEKTGLRVVTPRFDKTVRPETSSLPNEPKIFGRDNELEQVMRSLGVPTNSKRKRETSQVITSTSTSPSKQVRNESRKQSLPVLPIVGIGGVGKTTLAQHICNHEQVKSHFKLIIWVCVSDDFEVKRLTREVIQSCPGNKETYDNLDSLQRAVSDHLKNERFLIVLDDMWDDALKENGQCWRRFYAPLETSAQKGSMMLVTTRCPMVADSVRTMEPIKLQGLNDDVFWNFFKFYAFGSKISNHDPELERIGRNILPKLKGSPLAAKTLGRMLSANLQASHWNNISESELWELKQEATDILPALRLSYMYLPFYLKWCFSFCAVYPKDYIFKKEYLTEIWLAEGFVESEDIGIQYFEDLVARSFFQESPSGYVIHDLLHDMAQKVSEHDCFILRNKNDFAKVPKDVRHIYIHSSKGILISHLSRLSKHTKIRTIFCKKGLLNKASKSVMDVWCTKLPHIRVLSCASIHKLPDSIGNLKHLRYLEISELRGEIFNVLPLSIPSTFCCLYNLQTLYAAKHKIESLPTGFSNLNSLQTLKSHGFSYYSGCLTIDAASEEKDGNIRMMKNLNQIRGNLKISNCQMLTSNLAAEANLKSKQYLGGLTVWWMSPKHQQSPIMQHDCTEVLQVMQPPISLRTLSLKNYPGVSLPRWFQPQNFPNLTSVRLENCELLENIPFSMISHDISLNEIPAVLVDNNNDGTFLSLTEVTISDCQSLSSLEQFLHPDYVPAIKKIILQNCKSLLSVPTERFVDFCFLEELAVRGCPNIPFQCLVSESLKQLTLDNCGSLFENMACCTLTNLTISDQFITSIQAQMWSLPALRELKFYRCEYITSIGVSTFPSLMEVTISDCQNLSSLEHFLHPDYIPAIRKIHIDDCNSLASVPTERFETFRYLEDLLIRDCPSLNWEKGLKLPSSLQTLKLSYCGDFSASVPGCLENLSSLVSLKIVGCDGITSIPGSIWLNNALLVDLKIWGCENLVSIGGAEAVAKIKEVEIAYCPNYKEAEQIMKRS